MPRSASDDVEPRFRQHLMRLLWACAMIDAAVAMYLLKTGRCQMLNRKFRSMLAFGCIIAGAVIATGTAHANTWGGESDRLCNYCDKYDSADANTGNVRSSYVPISGYGTISK